MVKFVFGRNSSVIRNSASTREKANAVILKGTFCSKFD